MSSHTPASQMQTIWRRTEAHRIGYAFIFPVLILFLVFRIWPTINGFLLSFQYYRMRGDTDWVGLGNYKDLLGDDLFLHSLRVTVIYAAFSVPLSTIFGLLFAILINRKFKGIGWYRAIYFLPYITSLVMVAVIWQWVYRSNGGLLNGIFESLCLDPVGWLTSPNMVLPSLAIMATWKGVGYSMMILLAGLKAIPEHMAEASQVDGATEFQTFWRVTLPLLKPVLFFVVVIETIGSFQVFDAMFVMTGGGPVRASYSLVYMLYDESFRFQNYGYASAIGVILFGITFVAMMIQRVMFGKNDA